MKMLLLKMVSEWVGVGVAVIVMRVFEYNSDCHPHIV